MGEIQELKDKIMEKDNKIELLEKELEKRGLFGKEKGKELEEVKRVMNEKMEIWTETQEKYKRLEEDYDVLKEMFENQLKKHLPSNEE